MNWIKLKEHNEYKHRVYKRDGSLKKEVTIPAYHSKPQPHMPQARATKKRRFRINKNGRKVYIEGLVYEPRNPIAKEA